MSTTATWEGPRRAFPTTVLETTQWAGHCCQHHFTDSCPSVPQPSVRGSPRQSPPPLCPGHLSPSPPILPTHTAQAVHTHSTPQEGPGLCAATRVTACGGAGDRLQVRAGQEVSRGVSLSSPRPAAQAGWNAAQHKAATFETQLNCGEDSAPSGVAPRAERVDAQGGEGAPHGSAEPQRGAEREATRSLVAPSPHSLGRRPAAPRRARSAGVVLAGGRGSPEVGQQQTRLA